MCASRVERGEARGAEEGRASAMRPLDCRLVWRCAQLGAEGGFEERVSRTTTGQCSTTDFLAAHLATHHSEEEAPM